jgi:small ligand-binding sensory domain FIST
MHAADIRASHSTHADWQVAAQSCLQALGTDAAGANLGFLYTTDLLAPHFGDIAAFLRDRSGIEHWVGSVGLGICATGIEYFDRPALCLLTGHFPEQSFRVFSSVIDDLQAFEAAHGHWCEQSGARFAMVHGDPHNARITTMVDALCERLDGGFLVGGLTSSRGAHPQLADALTGGGLSGVLFDPQIKVATRLSQGCVPLGPRHTITRCRENLLIQLDGRPAVDVFYEDIGDLLGTDPALLGARVFAGLPVRASDTGDYLVRNLLAIDEGSGSMAIAEAVEEGDPVMFCRRDAVAAEQDMRRMLAEMARVLEGPPLGGIYYSCLARGPNLFGSECQELKLIEAALGRFPLVGFFGNGEISHNRLYAYTGVLTLFT